MEKEQASTAPSGQNSAQNPPPAPSSSSISPLEEDDIATNNTKGTLNIEPGQEQFVAETSPVALPILGKKKSTTAATTTDDEPINPSPLTNLSRHAITNEMVFGPIPDREYHECFMRKAIEMAQLALDSDETPVGCVFVRDGEVIGRGINGTNASLNGTRHAEFVALCEIMSRHHPSVLHTTDLYVTVEPCIMCASALRQFGIRSVYFGCLNDRFGGTGGVMTVHMDEGVDPPYPVYGGLFREEAIMLLRRFYVQENDKAPEPKPKKNRELKTEILPVGVPSGGNTPANLVSPAAATPIAGTPATETPTG
ncbi:hypothetical protein MBLNU13_g07192t1 [Cladosporium sp. NU13]